MASTGEADSPRDRGEQIQELVEHFQQCRRAGKPIARESVIAAHPQLMPELGHELHKAEIVADAADEAILQQWSSAEGRMSEETLSFELQQSAEAGEVTADLKSPQDRGTGCSDAPDQIGKYSVIRLLDRGGQSDVYLAVDPTLQRQVVIKVSRHRLPGGSASHEQLVRQGRLVTQLQHPNLDRVYELGFQDDYPFLVMEYVHGLNLVQHTRQKPLSPAESAALVAQLGHALAAAHEQGIIHRDIKPHNVVIGDDGTPRLIDFGMASIRDAWSGGSHREEGISGTPEYMAPEQARGEAIDHRSDVFALGAVLYFLLAGKAPFSAETRSESWKRAQACDFDRSAIRGRGIPRRLGRTSLQAMETNPDDRYATASKMAEDLEAFSSHWKLNVGFSFGVNQWRLSLALSIGLALLVAIVAAFLVTSTTRPIAQRPVAMHVSPEDPRPPSKVRRYYALRRNAVSKTEHARSRSAAAPLPGKEIEPVEGGATAPSGNRGPAASGGAGRRSSPPQPDAHALAKAERLFQEVYGEQLEAARASEDRLALARMLLAEAAKIGNEPAVCFVLLRHAQELAGDAGDAHTALEAADCVIQAFEVDPMETKLRCLSAVAEAAKLSTQRRALAEEAFALVDTAVEEDNSEAAIQLCDIARKAAQSTREYKLLKEISARREGIEEAQNKPATRSN